jgi:hypothetical protein
VARRRARRFRSSDAGMSGLAGVPNFLNLPFSVWGIGGAPADGLTSRLRIGSAAPRLTR